MTARDLQRRAARQLAPLQPRRALVAAGHRVSPRVLTALARGLGALEQGQWLRGTPSPVPNLKDRFAVFDTALEHVTGSRPLYLEFGVYRGRTIRYWASKLERPAARFVGFDSFEGLPEDWQSGAGRGAFSIGSPPNVEDPRVSFVVGWFDQTLAEYQPPEHDQLIVNLDCDLYSSSKVVLDWLAPQMPPGTLVYFDDLFNRDHQWRALREWLDGPGAAAVPLAMARWGHHMLFEIPAS